jgi:adenylate cyclase class 2
MLEIEIKSKIENAEEFKKILASLGAVEQEKIHESDQYFNHPCRDFAQSDEALRVRLTKDRALITYKGPKIDSRSKSRFEAETGISDPALMQAILHNLGFREVLRVEKERAVYALRGIIICVDLVEHLGAYVELEKIGDDRETIENELFALASELGLSDFERRSYLEMLLEKQHTLK